MDLNELSVKLDGSLRRIRDNYSIGRIDDAGREIRTLTEIIIFSLKEAANLDNSNTDIYVSVINELSSRGLIDDDERGKLHHLKNISNTFAHSAVTDRQGSPEERDKLNKYRNDFQRCFNFCVKEAEWAKEKFEELQQQSYYNDTAYSSTPYSVTNNDPFSDALASLDGYLESMQYNAGSNPDSAGMNMRDIFETILSVLSNITQVRPDPQEVSEKGDKIATISALARNGWINRYEEDNLHHLRTTANLFAHATKIEIENNRNDIVKLNEARNNIQTELRMCADMITWTKNRVTGIANGTFRPGDSYGNRRVLTEADDKRPAFLRGIFNYVLPFIFCLLSTLGVVYFLRHSNFIPSVEKIFTTDSLSGLSVKTHLIACAIMLVGFIFFYNVTFPAAAGCLFFLLTQSATGSDFCAGLTASLVIIMTLRYPIGLKRLFAAVTHGSWIITAEIITTCLIVQHLKAAGQPIDRYSIWTRIAPAIIGFILVYVIGSKVVNNLISQKPFDLAMENFNIEKSNGFIQFVAVLGTDIYLFHETWTKGLIFVTRKYYESPSLFWVIHFIIAIIVLYLIFIMYYRGSRREMNI